MKLYIAIIIMMLAIIAVPIIYILNARTSIYPYNTQMDYNYDFKGTDAVFFDISIKNQKFILPEIDKNDDISYSAFLKVEIDTTFLGKFFQPKATLTALIQESEKLLINNSSKKLSESNTKAPNTKTVKKLSESNTKALNTKTVSISDYFENGAEGIRYINITKLIPSLLISYPEDRPMEIHIQGKRAEFKDQKTKLILFKNQDIQNSKILILAPHPDDAEIAAFGLYSSIPDNIKKNIYIITVTAGDAGTYQYDEIYSSKKNHFLKKGKIRTWNSITVPLLGSIPPENVLNLGFFDGTLEKMFYVNPSSVKALYTGISNINIFRRQNISPLADILEGDASWNALVDNIYNLIQTIKPDIIAAPYPLIDKHPDHKFTSIALFEAIKKFDKDKLHTNEHNKQNQNYQQTNNDYNQTNNEFNSIIEEYDIKKSYLYLYTNHFILNEYYPYGDIGGVISLPPVFSDTNYDLQNIYFKSIYSHLLSSDRQKEKILSLEAMNDLRPDTSWRFSEDIIKMAAASIKRDILGKNASYYRRAVRNNELFFVVPVNNIYNSSTLNKITGRY